MNYKKQMMDQLRNYDYASNGRGNGFDELFQLELGHQEKKVRHYKQTIPVNIHHFYIVDDIKDVDYYLNMINVIRTAEQHDTIFIYLNTPGGNLYTTLQIMAAMASSNATIITSMEGQVCSAGTMIFLKGTKHLVNANSTFMIHNYSQFIGGKGNEIVSQVEFTKSFFQKLAEDVYGNFLTKEEILAVASGKDIWMDSDEVIKRLGDKVISQERQDSLEDIISTIIDQKQAVPPAPVAPAKPVKEKKKVAQKAKP